MSENVTNEVLIVGSGGNGIPLAVKLKEAGVTDFRIISKHRAFGGTWSISSARREGVVDVGAARSHSEKEFVR